MPTNETLIGSHFEKIVQDNFPNLKHIESKGVLPDFFNQNKGFWIEAKTGNIGWGVRIKREQIGDFQKLNVPVAYCVGLHDFDYATERLRGRTIRGKKSYLTRNFEVLETYFVSDILMKKLWEKEKRINKKGTQEYCMIKKHVLNRVFKNKTFGLENIGAEEFYDYNSVDFLISPINDLKPYGIFLHKEKDKNIIDYLMSFKHLNLANFSA